VARRVQAPDLVIRKLRRSFRRIFPTPTVAILVLLVGLEAAHVQQDAHPPPPTGMVLFQLGCLLGCIAVELSPLFRT
jgi:hypothetical protein